MKQNKEWSCICNCGLCCGPFPMDYGFWLTHRDKAKKCEMKFTVSTATPVSDRCPFLDDKNKCVVYDDRPLICRNFGIDPKLPCPFLKPNGSPRSDAGRKKIFRQAKRNVFREFGITQKDVNPY
jgi:Fe-S-cluster containining protein